MLCEIIESARLVVQQFLDFFHLTATLTNNSFFVMECHPFGLGYQIASPKVEHGLQALAV
jgi:hypothetical protein